MKSRSFMAAKYERFTVLLASLQWQIESQHSDIHNVWTRCLHLDLSVHVMRRRLAAVSDGSQLSVYCHRNYSPNTLKHAR